MSVPELNTSSSTGSRRRRRGQYSYRYKRPWHPTLNLTPMIDTVFNLLFFFMVASRFGAIEGLLPAKLPVHTGAAQANAVPRMPLRIHLVPDAKQADRCNITIDRFQEKPLAIGQLPKVLQKIRHEQSGFDSDTPVYLMAADDVAWNHVVNAYNAALTADYEKIFFGGGS